LTTAENLGLKLEIDARSWHYPGGTLLLMFFQPDISIPYTHKVFADELESLGITDANPPTPTLQ
jgi:hypothetical protein